MKVKRHYGNFSTSWCSDLELAGAWQCKFENKIFKFNPKGALCDKATKQLKLNFSCYCGGA
jgi:hypothetical protein